ncbi:MAG: hypothetical protein ACRDH2_01260 [Anaerolineales bacterium]
MPEQRLGWRLGFAPKLVGCFLSALIAMGGSRPALAVETGLLQEAQTVRLDFHYELPEAGEVVLVWGINGWAAVPEALRPAGTTLENNVMHTPMTHEDGRFIAIVQAPSDAIVDYGFLITKMRDGTAINPIWDGRDDYQALATQASVIEIKGGVTLDKPSAFDINAPLVTQNFRYELPGAGEVFLVWGVNGWVVVPESLRPAGTTLQNNVMHTPMTREEDTFVATVRVPSGATLDYGFLITKKRDGTAITPFWDGSLDYQTAAIVNNTIELEASSQAALRTTPVEQVLKWPGFWLIVIGGSLILVIGLIRWRFSKLA